MQDVMGAGDGDDGEVDVTLAREELDAQVQENTELQARIAEANEIIDYESEQEKVEVSQQPQKFIVAWRGLYSLELLVATTYTRPEAELVAQNLLIDNRPSRIYKVDLP